MDSFDLFSSDHFHVILHPDREHGIIFNRSDETVTTINYDDAKGLSNLKLIARTYGIVGRFLGKYLVLISSCSRVGTLFEPETKTEHDVFVIDQVQVIDLSSVSSTEDTNVATNSDVRLDNIKDVVRYNPSSSRNDGHDKPEQIEFTDRCEIDEFSSLPVTISTNSYNSAQSRSAQWNPFRLANSFKPMAAQFLRSVDPNNQDERSINESLMRKSTSQNESNQSATSIPSQHQDADRRLAEEMMKLFNNTNSFYFSATLDLTNRFSKKCPKIRVKGNEAIWKTADERFFWNKHMSKDLIELSKDNEDANYFICIILQGFISIEQQITYSNSRQKYDREFNAVAIHDDLNEDVEIGRLAIESTESPSENSSIAEKSERDCDASTAIKNQEIQVTKLSNTKLADKDKSHYVNTLGKGYQLALISRRSVFQAGTRYRRRGCDELGNCANFVETEQIFRSHHHFTSLIIIRGSIPLFWYQTGYNYRPPPMLTRSDEENHQAFRKHFENLFSCYQTEQIISIDCTESTGREKVLHDAFREHMNKLGETYSKLKLIEFDFHKYCRGRQCMDDQVERHLSACGLTSQLLKDVKYYWNDGDVIWNQEGVFRVNCLDCSDRTNVVQRNIALQILDLQLARLGLIAPDPGLNDNVYRKLMQTMWSANGNVLSTQYCGTRALFGGDSKKLTGYLKDTYSSASRYYISKFRDVYRQAAIDAMLGVESAETKDLKSENVREQYELLSFDPILAGSRQGGALLRDMGNRVGNRLARLRGKLVHVRPFGQFNTTSLGVDNLSHTQSRPTASSTYFNRIGGPASSAGRRNLDDNEIIETGLVESLVKLNIDWPTSESMENLHHHSSLDQRAENQKKDVESKDVFARFSDCEDCFQDDDDFGKLMDDY